MRTETGTWQRAGKEDVLALVKGLWFPIGTSHGEIVAFANTLETRDAIIADHEAASRLKAWEDAMTDVSVINWTLAEDNAEDLHKQLMAVIAQNVKEQLDPVVSEQASREAALREDADALRGKLRQISQYLGDVLMPDGTLNAHAPTNVRLAFDLASEPQAEAKHAALNVELPTKEIWTCIGSLEYKTVLHVPNKLGTSCHCGMISYSSHVTRVSHITNT